MPDSMEMILSNGFCSFALSLAHDKFDVWTWPEDPRSVFGVGYVQMADKMSTFFFGKNKCIIKLFSAIDNFVFIVVDSC